MEKKDNNEIIIYHGHTAAEVIYERVDGDTPLMGLDKILSSTDRALLNGPESVSHQEAMEKAEKGYRRFQVRELSAVE